MTGMQARYNVLFLCTGNSARSIMAEAILNGKASPSWSAYSAGSHPSGVVRPEALRLIGLAHLPTEGLRSKSWEEFRKPGAPKMNFVFTVCDNAAQEMCPVWPGQPMTAHWGVPDPAEAKGTHEQIERAFRGGGCRLRHHGGAACQRERGVGFAGEHDHYRCSACRTYPHFWTHFRRAFQSGGLRSGRNGRRIGLVQSSSVHRRATLRWHCRNDGGARHVWDSADFRVAPHPGRSGSIPQRVHRNVWTPVRYLGMLA